MDQVSTSRSIRVAGGAFAPGHLGELTRLVPFEMVDDVLESTGRVQSRVRVLPARVVVYLLLAAALFADLGYTQVWDKLCVGLTSRRARAGGACPRPPAYAVRLRRPC
ncbi:transposase domain-containing protein [Actinospica sp. MGRD01-02]|uniref:Transposase domain-containing protein n=1 Tax=Actinospica acidithermotolerans TaxID=2828514 RepID=A0A941IGC0_9ACTN|nr:transposase domain-containing protein [Actinospica acidithermotolerans]